MVGFGGIGTEILMFRTQFEKELERVDLLMKQIADQQELVATTADSIRKFFDDHVIRFRGDLEKLSGATDFGNNLAKCLDLIGRGHEQLSKLKQLMAECASAQDRARAAMPDFTMFATDGRHDVPPGRTFFLATKNAGASPDTRPFDFSATKHRPVDPVANLAAIQLGRRFLK